MHKDHGFAGALLHIGQAYTIDLGLHYGSRGHAGVAPPSTDMDCRLSMPLAIFCAQAGSSPLQ